MGHAYPKVQMSAVLDGINELQIPVLSNVNPSYNVRHFDAANIIKIMMTSSNGNIFRVTGHLYGGFTGYKGQWRGPLMFTLICVWIYDWVNNREAGGLRRYRAQYDVTPMMTFPFQKLLIQLTDSDRFTTSADEVWSMLRFNTVTSHEHHVVSNHYNSIVCSTVCYANIKNQCTALLYLCEGNPLMASPHKGPVKRSHFMTPIDYYFLANKSLKHQDTSVLSNCQWYNIIHQNFEMSYSGTIC